MPSQVSEFQRGDASVGPFPMTGSRGLDSTPTVLLWLSEHGRHVMTAVISEVYKAFKEAKVSDNTARKASEAIAAYESRFANIDLKIEKLDGRLTLVMWQLAILIGGVATLIIKAFT